MDATDMTCPNCGTAWQIIKAPDGPITCPNCKAVVGAAPTVASGPDPTPSPPAADSPPAPAPTPAAAVQPVTRPAADLTDADDPGLGRPARGRFPEPTPVRRGRHPLVTVAIVLLLLLLVPIALCSVLFAVCTFAFG